MKYKVAICDDEVSTCEELDAKTKSIFTKLGYDVEVDVYYSGETFVNHICRNNPYDFILLDIELFELNGIGVGKYIRDYIMDFRTQIVYISSKTTYAMELFEISPLDFLVKPIYCDQLTKTYERGMAIIGTLQECFECTNGNTVIRVPFAEILYMESEGRKVKLVTSNEEIFFYDKLSNVIKSLSTVFIQIHKSYIVNTNAIKEYHSDRVVLFNLNELPISRTYRDIVKKYMIRRDR